MKHLLTLSVFLMISCAKSNDIEENENKTTLGATNLLLTELKEKSSGEIGSFAYSFNSQINFDIDCKSDMKLKGQQGWSVFFQSSDTIHTHILYELAPNSLVSSATLYENRNTIYKKKFQYDRGNSLWGTYTSFVPGEWETEQLILNNQGAISSFVQNDKKIDFVWYDGDIIMVKYFTLIEANENKLRPTSADMTNSHSSKNRFIKTYSNLLLATSQNDKNLMHKSTDGNSYWLLIGEENFTYDAKILSPYTQLLSAGSYYTDIDVLKLSRHYPIQSRLYLINDDLKGINPIACKTSNAYILSQSFSLPLEVIWTIIGRGYDPSKSKISNVKEASRVIYTYSADCGGK